MAKAYLEDKVYDLPVKEIVLGPQLIRHDVNDDSVIEMADSIIQQSLLQPGGFTQLEDGTLQLLWGSRRLTAYKRLKRKTFPCTFKANRGSDVKTIAIVENIQRRDLTLNEECDAITHLHEHENLSPDQIAIRVSKSREWVMRRLMLPGLPEALKGPVFDGRLPIAQAEALALIQDPSILSYALQQVYSQRLTGPQTRELVQILSETPTVSEAVEAGVLHARSQSRSDEPRLKCEACNYMVPIQRIIIVRICNDGCVKSKAENVDIDLTGKESESA